MEALVFIYIIIPACIIGFIIGFSIVYYWFLRDWDKFSKLLIGIITGLVLGCLSPYIIGIPFFIKFKIEDYKANKIVNEEINYFKEISSGKHSENEIKQHYAKHPLSGQGVWKIESDRQTPGSLAYPGTVIDPQTLSILIEVFNKMPSLVGALANRPEAPLALKLKIALLPDPHAVLDMARNSDTPPIVLTKLSTHKDEQIAHYVCKNEGAPIEAKLICDIRDSLKENALHVLGSQVDFPAMFESKREELALWRMLVKDPREHVRMYVARSKYTPPEVLTDLSNDPSDSILQFVFLHKNTPLHIRHKIAKHFKSNMNTILHDLCKNENTELREAVAKSPITKHDILNTLSKDSNHLVRATVAANPNTDSNTLQSLAKNNEDIGISQIIIENPNTPLKILEGYGRQPPRQSLTGVGLSRWASQNKMLSERAEIKIRMRR